jgi:hypothetical protein
MLFFVLAAAITLTSCENEVYSPMQGNNSSETVDQEYLTKGNGKNKGKPKKDDPVEDPVVDPEPDPFVTTYQLLQADDSDPLFRFSISQSGELMLLETDPEVTSWGTDYWGYWSDPFLYENGEVNYIIGLTNTTYQFQPLQDNKMEVTKTLIVQPYPSGDPTTTITRPGVYVLIN